LRRTCLLLTQSGHCFCVAEYPLLAQSGHSSFDLIRVLRSHGGPTERLGPPTENSINHRDLEGIVVNPVNSSAVAQAKPRRSGFDPFERRFFCPFLIFKNCVFLSVIVNEFKFVYLASFSVFHSRLRLAILRLQLRRLVNLENPATVIGSCCRCQRTEQSRALYRCHARLLLCLVRVRRAAAC
jgi:hypothetical protein